MTADEALVFCDANNLTVSRRTGLPSPSMHPWIVSGGDRRSSGTGFTLPEAVAAYQQDCKEFSR